MANLMPNDPLVLERSVIGVEASARSAGGVRAQCRDRLERILAMASIRLWEGLEAELAFDMEYVQGGNIRLAANEERMAQLATEAEEELADGLVVEIACQVLGIHDGFLGFLCIFF